MEDKKQIKEINASSMADIAFLLLIFFLVATTMNVDTGITRQLPPIPPEEQRTEDVKVRERDLLTVFVNQYDQVLVAGQVAHITQVKDIAKNFVLNPADDVTMPEKEIKELAMPDGTVWSVPVSKAIVSLMSDRGTSYDMYIKVQNELTRAFNEMRDEAARAKFGGDFINLDDDQREVITKVVPLSISEAEPKNAGGN